MIRIIFIIFGMAVGGAIAWLLNEKMGKKINNKNARLGVNIAAYSLFIILGLLFGLTGSIKPVLNRFLDNRINDLEVMLNSNFPSVNIMEININTDEFVEYSEQLQQELKNFNTGSDSLFESLVYDALMGKLNPYINTVDRGVSSVAAMSDDKGNVTIKAIIVNLKKTALDAISPFFIIFNILIIIGVIVCIICYVGIVSNIIKDSANNQPA